MLYRSFVHLQLVLMALPMCRCMKSICAEAWDTTSQAKSLGIMSLGWTMGSTLGPAFAGAFSEPCKVFGPKFPFCGPHGLFQLR